MFVSLSFCEFLFFSLYVSPLISLFSIFSLSFSHQFFPPFLPSPDRLASHDHTLYNYVFNNLSPLLNPLGAPDQRFCDIGPRHQMMKYNDYLPNMHCIGPPVNVGSCGNMLCQGEEGTCCRGKDYEELQVELTCFSMEGSRRMVMGGTHEVSETARRINCWL